MPQVKIVFAFRDDEPGVFHKREVELERSSRDYPVDASQPYEWSDIRVSVDSAIRKEFGWRSEKIVWMNILPLFSAI